jgi:hypothetical protein
VAAFVLLEIANRDRCGSLKSPAFSASGSHSTSRISGSWLLLAQFFEVQIACEPATDPGKQYKKKQPK